MIWVLIQGACRVHSLIFYTTCSPFLDLLNCFNVEYTLTNKFGTSTIQIPSIANVKFDLGDNNVFVMFDYDDEGCHVVDHLDILPYPFRNVP
jgi:hypothetical protein